MMEGVMEPAPPFLPLSLGCPGGQPHTLLCHHYPLPVLLLLPGGPQTPAEGRRGCVRGDAELGSPRRAGAGGGTPLPLPGGTSFPGHPWQKRGRVPGQAAVSGSGIHPPPGPAAPASRPPPLLCDESGLSAGTALRAWSR